MSGIGIGPFVNSMSHAIFFHSNTGALFISSDNDIKFSMKKKLKGSSYLDRIKQVNVYSYSMK